jgi:putative phosphoribosyl transferase
LARELERYRGERPVVLGIPRGGVPVAAVVARHLRGELDVIVARKLGAPMHEELAIGAVTADGGRFLNRESPCAARGEEYLSQVLRSRCRRRGAASSASAALAPRYRWPGGR